MNIRANNRKMHHMEAIMHQSRLLAKSDAIENIVKYIEILPYICSSYVIYI
jgi:hypothetical protein